MQVIDVTDRMSSNESKAVVNIDGVTVVLDRVATVGEISQAGIQFIFDIETTGHRTTFRFRNGAEAKLAREQFVEALTDWWANKRRQKTK